MFIFVKKITMYNMLLCPAFDTREKAARAPNIQKTARIFKRKRRAVFYQDVL
jgi:hypothetical protein